MEDLKHLNETLLRLKEKQYGSESEMNLIVSILNKFLPTEEFEFIWRQKEDPDEWMR